MYMFRVQDPQLVGRFENVKGHTVYPSPVMLYVPSLSKRVDRLMDEWCLGYSYVLCFFSSYPIIRFILHVLICASILVSSGGRENSLRLARRRMSRSQENLTELPAATPHKGSLPRFLHPSFMVHPFQQHKWYLCHDHLIIIWDCPSLPQQRYTHSSMLHCNLPSVGVQCGRVWHSKDGVGAYPGGWYHCPFPHDSVWPWQLAA